MGTVPPTGLIDWVDQALDDLLSRNPAATSSEAYLQHHLEFAILAAPVTPRYHIRIGINYHGQKVQHLQLDETTGVLIGWNPTGDALATGSRARMLLAGHTIFPRDPSEPMMSDTKIGGGRIPSGRYVRLEFKARGWLGKTKNLDGKQFEKDLDLLKNDRADLIVACLSETAHRKWCGEGPLHHALRRTGCERFREILVDVGGMSTDRLERTVDFEGQPWVVRTRRIRGAPDSIMPGALHLVTFCWRDVSQLTA